MKKWLQYIGRRLHLMEGEHRAYNCYRVDMRFLNGLAAGAPATPFLANLHAQKFAAGVRNALQLSKKNTGGVDEAAMEAYVLQLSSVFLVDDDGIYIHGYQFNALLKDAAQRLKVTLKQKGLNNTLRDGGVLFPRKVHLHREPTFVEKPVKPDNGPANIKRFQVAEDVALTVPFAVLQNGDLPDELLKAIWREAQIVGLGANRHLGYGLFRVGKLEQDDSWDMEDILDGKVKAELMQAGQEGK